MTQKDNIKVIIGGGGTGGHIFPAIAIADGIKARYPKADILFVGADNRMEMERVPKAGYPIEGLPVRGFYRKLTLKNFGVLTDYFKSVRKAKQIIKKFKPDVAVGVGGYASAPIIKAAVKAGVPALIQEQNSYAGVTNRMLSKKVRKICVAYDEMERYFPAGKIQFTGNPVRQFEKSDALKQEALKHFGLSADKPVLLVIGGSLGARTVNNALKKGIDQLANNDIQVIWQTGKYYYEKLKEEVDTQNIPNLKLLDFVTRMDLAYNVADMVISRAGALSISEICLLGKAAILVPSPNVAEDHQTKNAMALVKHNAANMVKDVEAEDKLIPLALSVLKDEKQIKKLEENVVLLAKPNATEDIVKEVLNLVSE
ncbi:MAG: undecaprenyldiphospho-muramoylpentapeptide beta-N-acetylglucosaminyltransferase [Bacteroidales bacterium]|nr:undecaprenyldiphospho-muramoylpentapeptide beta-N-acetylglucosaminyltransferase [Bacteroidales bacterium]